MTGTGRPTQAKHIFDLLGGRSETGRILGWPLTKVDSCLRTGWIHGKDHAHVLNRAWAEGININQLDFVVHLSGMHRPAPTQQRTATAG